LEGKVGEAKKMKDAEGREAIFTKKGSLYSAAE